MPDLVIYQGDDYRLLIKVVNGDGSDPDLSLYTAQAQIRSKYADDSDVEVDFTTAIDSPNIELTLTNQQTQGLPGGKHRWDCQLTSPDNKITTVAAGEVRVTQEVTRTTP